MGDAVNFGVNRVRVFSGASHTLIYTLNGANNSGFGTSIAGLGDLNGDGRGDFAVGSAVGLLGAADRAGLFRGDACPSRASSRLVEAAAPEGVFRCSPCPRP